MTADTPTDTPHWHRWLALSLFLLSVVGGGALIGAASAPGAWYQELQKPAFTPPNWIFAPVWTALYILIAIAGWRLWRSGDDRLKGLWLLQMGLNFAWSPVFFSAHLPGLALAVILALLATIATIAVLAWRRDRVVSWMFLPYLAWVGFATVLNAAFVALN